MIESSTAYKNAVTGYARRTRIKCHVKLTSPDLVYGSVVTSGGTVISRPTQIYDEVYIVDPNRFNLERNMWLLDGTFVSPYATPVGQIGVELSGWAPASSPSYSSDYFVELQFSGVKILQTCSFHFSDKIFHGFPVGFTVQILSGDAPVYTETITDNKSRDVTLKNFTVYYPTAIRITFTEWSLPYRRPRILELVPGLREYLTERNLTALSVKQQGDVSALTLPYGTAELTLDNEDRKYDPRNAGSIFESIEARQSIYLAIGVDTEDGETEYKSLGIFYQAANGWTTADEYMTIDWSLVDIIGLLNQREFRVPDTLPTTLEGWAANLVSQLGINFEGRYRMDEEDKSIPMTARADALTGCTCGDVLLWICQASQRWARADATTGYLAIEPTWNAGVRYKLEDMENRPVYSMNDELGGISVTTHSTGNTDVTHRYFFPGTSEAAPESSTIDNPFLHTDEDARNVAWNVILSYGGFRLKTVGRGNPASEIGDVDIIDMDKTNATSGRRISQTFQFQNGIMRGCESEFLQANGWSADAVRVEFTEDGTFTFPPGVTEAFIFLVGGGQGGGGGMDGEDWSYVDGYFGEGPKLVPGEDSQTKYNISHGDHGKGGKVFYKTIRFNEGQTVNVTIGQGGKGAKHYRWVDFASTAFKHYLHTVGRGAGYYGTPTTMSFSGYIYSSENGHSYEAGYSDLRNKTAYGRTGVRGKGSFDDDGYRIYSGPEPNSGDGGTGGQCGQGGQPPDLPGNPADYKDQIVYTWVDIIAEKHNYPQFAYLIEENPGAKTIWRKVTRESPDERPNAELFDEKAAFNTAGTEGEDGVDGASGIAVIYYNLSEEE